MLVIKKVNGFIILRDNSSMSNSLTKYQKGSMKEMLYIFVPLMLGNLSSSLMTFSDRIFVSRLGLEHLQGLNNAGIICFTVVFSLSGIAGTAAIFVGRFNGEGNLHKVCAPVWQMIYFALMCSLLTLPTGIFGAEYFLANEVMATGQGYFKWAMSGAFLPVLISAISTFFGGTGDTKKITISTFIANGLNLVLNTFLIFGCPGCFREIGLDWFEGQVIIAPMYGKGAAIATVISQVVQIVILIFFMLKANNRYKYKTHAYVFNPHLFKNCLRIGGLSALTRFLEMVGWIVVTNMLTKYSLQFLNIQAIYINMFIAFSFIVASLRESTAIIISNHIGANSFEVISFSLKAALKIPSICLIVIFIPMLIFNDFTMAFLTGGNNELRNDIIFYQALKYSLPIMMLSIYISTITNGVAFGMFVAGGSMRYVTFVNTIATWCFAVIPIAIIIKYFNIPLKYSIWMYQPYRVFIIIALYFHYLRGKWICKIE